MTKSIFTSQYDKLCTLLIQGRISAGMSQAQLAKCLNRPQSFVSKYETKQRRLDVVEFLEIAHCMKANGIDLLRKLMETEEPIGGASLLVPRMSVADEAVLGENGVVKPPCSAAEKHSEKKQSGSEQPTPRLRARGRSIDA